MNIKHILSYYSDDISSIESWIDDMYNDLFSSVFNKLESYRADIVHLTDDQLEDILTGLPLELIVVSENLNSLKAQCSVMKLKQKEIKHKFACELMEENSDNHLTKTDISYYSDLMMVEHRVATSAYDSLIQRVENNISMAKELIMGCKKIWDARRANERNVIETVVTEKEYPDLPDYSDINF